jgi:hypothetical protein
MHKAIKWKPDLSTKFGPKHWKSKRERRNRPQFQRIKGIFSSQSCVASPLPLYLQTNQALEPLTYNQSTFGDRHKLKKASNRIRSPWGCCASASASARASKQEKHPPHRQVIISSWASYVLPLSCTAGRSCIVSEKYTSVWGKWGIFTTNRQIVLILSVNRTDISVTTTPLNPYSTSLQYTSKIRRGSFASWRFWRPGVGASYRSANRLLHLCGKFSQVCYVCSNAALDSCHTSCIPPLEVFVVIS